MRASRLVPVLLLGALGCGGAPSAGDPVDAGEALDADVADSGPAPSGDFTARCAAAGVVRCVGFDRPADLVGTYGDNHGTLVGDAAPDLDPAVKASGASALRFTIPARSSANSSGSYFLNFSDDLSVQFDGGDEFFVQWRQRFSSALVAADYAGGGGWKQLILGTGDRPGCTASTSAGGQCASSCTTLELVVQSYLHRGFPMMYNSCTGSASHGAYDGFFEPFGAYDFKLQNARPAPYCLYSQRGAYLPPAGACFGHAVDEWMTFQVGVTLGPRQGDEFVGSRVRLWMARAGQPSELVIDWGPYNLSAGRDGERYGKVWLLPYNTRKDPTVTYPEAYTWYDELIVSRQRIGDPR